MMHALSLLARAYGPRAIALASLALALAFSAVPALSQSDNSALLERRVKAAFLFKFVDFVEWPQGTFAGADAPLMIGIVGDDGVAAELAQIVSGRPADRHALTVKRLNDGDPLDGLHIVFVARSAARTLSALTKTPTRPVLVVTESPGALNRGGIINFVMHDGRLRFDVALDEAEKRSLKLSSRLLTVAQNVRAGPQP